MLIWLLIFGAAISVQKKERKHRALISSGIASAILVIFQLIRIALMLSEYGGLKVVATSSWVLILLVEIIFSVFTMITSHMYDNDRISKKKFIIIIALVFVATSIISYILPVQINEDKVKYPPEETIESTEEMNDTEYATDKIRDISFRVPSYYSKMSKDEKEEMLGDSVNTYKGLVAYQSLASNEDTVIIVGYLNTDYTNIEDYVNGLDGKILESQSVDGVNGKLVSFDTDMEGYYMCSLLFIKNGMLYNATAISNSETPQYKLSDITNTIKFN